MAALIAWLWMGALGVVVGVPPYALFPVIFFVAFVPQFVDPNVPALQQFIFLEITFLVLAAASVAVWAVLAGQMRSKFKRPETVRLVNRTGGGFLVGAGLFTAALRH